MEWKRVEGKGRLSEKAAWEAVCGMDDVERDIEKEEKNMPIRVVDTVCDYCKAEVTFQDKGIIIVNGQVAHRSCAERAGDVQAFMQAPEPTHEQKLMIEMDRQTAEHLYNTGQYMEVVAHVGGMYGQSREEALSSRREGTWKDQADWCMTQL